MPDLDDTSRCPRGGRCESCADQADDLAVAAVRMGALGVGCLTLCSRCRRGAASVLPSISVGTTVKLCLQHAQHLGIDADQMAEALRER